ncbi:shikimate kinase [Bacteroidota bacterium]
MQIFLVGFMGCGKTSIGKKLANRLNLHFVDLDNYIEQKTGKKISLIFETQGEETFRKFENKYLKELQKKDNILISTGGGTPCFLENMELINNTGISIYLEMNTQSLVQRLMNAKSQRPLIIGKNKKELADYVEKTLAEREQYYKKANIIINALHPDISELSKQILNQTQNNN